MKIKSRNEERQRGWSACCVWATLQRLFYIDIVSLCI